MMVKTQFWILRARFHYNGGLKQAFAAAWLVLELKLQCLRRGLAQSNFAWFTVKLGHCCCKKLLFNRLSIMIELAWPSIIGAQRKFKLTLDSLCMKALSPNYFQHGALFKAWNSGKWKRIPNFPLWSKWSFGQWSTTPTVFCFSLIQFYQLVVNHRVFSGN